MTVKRNQFLLSITLIAFLVNYNAITKLHANDDFITVVSTTSLQASGFYDYIVPIFEQENNFNVRVVAVGTGKAMRIAQSGDADLLITHHQQSEKHFIHHGYGDSRHIFMYNHFILLGPKNTIKPYKELAASSHDINHIMQTLYKLLSNKEIKFLSRGDDSGTHKKELEIWQQAGISQNDLQKLDPQYYLETGSGMGKSLIIAQETNSFILSDYASWINLQRDYKTLDIVLAETDIFYNPYAIILLNKEKFPFLKLAKACIFAQWLVTKGQRYIKAFKKYDKNLFTPVADHIHCNE